MIRSLYSSSSGMRAQQLNLDVLANNLANVNTTGFKKNGVDFQSLFYQSLKAPTVSSTTGLNNFGVEVGNGVRVAATRTSYANGGLQETGHPLDVAIEGQGFFMVHLPNGEIGFTRAGAFRLDNEGYLVSPNGYKVLSSQGNVSPEKSASLGGKDLKYIQPVTEKREVLLAVDGTITTENLDTTPPILELAHIANPEGLQAVGSTAYVATEVCGEITVGQPAVDENLGALHPGFLEASNVNVVEEMIKMIMAQRAYEIGSKAIQTSDDMMGVTNNLKR